ncbi:MAG: hypothetical protein ACLFMM_02660 [Methanohalobium sp.]|uniref:hypothetical protein n=1 Tax=Methanohalobium sp. TaxID=2837493 RepID=UPI00397978EB
MPDSKKLLENYFFERFGVNRKLWKHYNVYWLGNSLWITSPDLEPSPKYISCGIRALRIMDSEFKSLKPTTYVLQYLGENIKKNIADIDTNDLKTIINGRYLENNSLGYGYIALRYRNYIIGCGLKNSHGIKNQIPKGRKRELEEILDEE